MPNVCAAALTPVLLGPKLLVASEATGEFSLLVSAARVPLTAAVHTNMMKLMVLIAEMMGDSV